MDFQCQVLSRGMSFDIQGQGYDPSLGNFASIPFVKSYKFKLLIWPLYSNMIRLSLTSPGMFLRLSDICKREFCNFRTDLEIHARICNWLLIDLCLFVLWFPAFFGLLISLGQLVN